MRTRFWWGNLKERNQGRARLRWEDDIKMALRNVVKWHGLDPSVSGK